MSQPMTPVNAAGQELHKGSLPNGAVAVQTSSGNKAAATAAAALAAQAGKTNFLAGFSVTGSGATTGLPVIVTVTGVLGGTLSYIHTFPAGVLVPCQPLVVKFDPPIPASAVNTAITVSCPTSGSGGTHNAVNANGYYA